MRGKSYAKPHAPRGSARNSIGLNPAIPPEPRDSDSRMPIINAQECEQIAEEMVAAGWVVVVRVILGESVPWIVHATRGDGVRHIVHADEITAAFLELKRQTLRTTKTADPDN